MPYPGLLDPEPLSLQQATAALYLQRRNSDTVLAQACGLGMCFVPFLGQSSLGNQVLGKCTVPCTCQVHLNHLPSPLLDFPGAPWEHHHRCAVCLLWRAYLCLRPSWWMSTIQDLGKIWLAAGSLHSLAEDAAAPCLLVLTVAGLPFCLQVGSDRLAVASSPLVFTQSFVLWVARLPVRFKPFAGKFSFPQLRLGVYSVCSVSFFFPPGYVALWDSKTPYRPACERISYSVETSSLSRLHP